MNIHNLIFNRLIQFVLAIVRRFIKAPQQLTFAGQGSAEQLCAHIVRSGCTRVLLVTDKPLVELGLAARVTKAIESAGAPTAVFDGVLPDPSVAVVQAALDSYRGNRCDAIVALGGGSSIDTAKAAAAAATNGGIDKIMGLFKVKQAPAPLYAIPTTAGTGSEVSFFAVISDTHTHQKTGIGAPAMLPKATALDASLMTGLPPHITAATGLDALTHAVETYIATAANDEVRAYSKPAVEMIFNYLPRAYDDGKDMAAREAMTIASYYAGLSLNIAAVGYVHAIAHNLGAKYGTPHGLANAIVLPYVLELNIKASCEPLAELADLIGVGASGDSRREKASKFIAAVRQLNQRLNIPDQLEALRAADIRELAVESVREGRTYAVPEVLSVRQVTSVLQQMLA